MMNSSHGAIKKTSPRDRAAGKPGLFEKEFSAVIRGQQRNGKPDQGSRSKNTKKGTRKGTKKRRNDGGRSESEVDEEFPHLLHRRWNEFPERQPDSYPQSENEDSKDFSDRARTPYAGKKLLKKKRKEARQSDPIQPPLVKKRPRGVETVIPETAVPKTVIPETEEINRRNEQEGTLQSGAAIAGYHNLSEIGKQGIISSPFLKSFVARISAQFAEKVSTQLGDMSKKLDLLVAQVASLERDVSDVRALASSNGAIASKDSLEKDA